MRFAAFTVVLAICIPHVRAGTSLQTVWTLPLRSVSPAMSKEWTSYAVWGLSFSPDGNRIAIGYGDSTEQSEIKRRLVIVSRNNPAHVERTFELPIRLFPVHWFGSPLSFSWSPDGNRLALSSGEVRDAWSFILEVRTGSQYHNDAPRIAFLASGEGLAIKRLPNTGVSMALLKDPRDSDLKWVDYSGYEVYVASPSGDLIAADRREPVASNPTRKREGVIVDAASLPQIRLRATLGDFVPRVFVRGGRTTCGQHPSGEWWCRDLVSGKETRITVPTRGVPLGAAARLVIPEYKKHTLPEELATVLDMSSVWYGFKRRVVWDLDRNGPIAAYSPKTIPFRSKGLRGGTRIFAYALSPNGEYLADGSPDSVTLYKIPSP